MMGFQSRQHLIVDSHFGRGDNKANHHCILAKLSNWNGLLQKHPILLCSCKVQRQSIESPCIPFEHNGRYLVEVKF
jgi:hypothetical protein